MQLRRTHAPAPVPSVGLRSQLDAHRSDDRCHLRLLLRGARKDQRIRMDIPEMRFEPAVLSNDEIAVRAGGIDHVALVERLERSNGVIEVS